MKKIATICLLLLPFLGQGQFIPLKTLTPINFIDVVDAALEDIDQDGDKDIIVALDYKISLFRNIEGFNFGEEEIISDGIFHYSLSSMVLYDLDKDGDLDIIASHSKPVQLVWYENNNGNFLTQQVIVENTEFLIPKFYILILLSMLLSEIN